MGIRRDRIKELDTDLSRSKIVQRDKGKCFKCDKETVDCDKEAVDIHEIVSRSHWGTRRLHICFDEKNRVCLCRKCHDEVQGQGMWMTRLLAWLRDKYGYEYSEQEFRRYLG
jgi:hypothetical protein